MSPTDILSVDEVPFEGFQVENVQVQRIRLHAVQFAVGSFLGLTLVEVALGSRFAIQLLDFVRVYVEQVAVVRLLVGGGEPSEDDHVVA